MNKRVFLISLIFVFALMIQFSSATLSLTEPKKVYSIGDELNVTATLQTVQGGNGFFVATLKCDTKDVELLRMPYSTKPGQTSNFYLTAMLDRALIGSLQGNCYVEASYGDEISRTSDFEISSKVIITLDVQGNLFEPKQDVSLSGTAVLINGQSVNGIVVVEIINTNISVSTSVENGRFSSVINLPERIASGAYDIRVTVSQRDEYGNALNAGSYSEQIKIKQVVESVEVALSNVTVQPGTDLSYQIVLYDQVAAKATQDATVRLISPSGRIVVEKISNSGLSNNYFAIGKDYAPGIWTIQAQVKDITANKTFGITELKEISVLRENSTMIIKNTGNVVYTDQLEVLVGDNVEVVELNLEVGQEKRMKLFAPQGSYDIKTRSAQQNFELGTTFLTGNAIRVSDLSDVQAAKVKMWFWVIVIIIIAYFALKAYRKFRKNRVFVSPSSSKDNVDVKKMFSKKNNSEESFIWKSSSPRSEMKTLSGVQQTRTISRTEDFGRKEESSILVLKIKNNDELTKYKGSEPAMDAIVRATGLARTARAKVSREENFTVMTFSKTATGSDNPHLQAARVGKEIEALFKSHNRKYARKIAFGLGLVTGEMIVEKQGSNIQHTATGAIIPLAKKIATHAYDAMLVDNSTHGKLRGVVKSEKGIGGMYWTINSFIDRENHNEFIKKFMERRADESKSF